MKRWKRWERGWRCGRDLDRGICQINGHKMKANGIIGTGIHKCLLLDLRNHWMHELIGPSEREQAKMEYNQNESHLDLYCGFS